MRIIGGDVEHYRPKGAIGSGKTKIRPGYYWLAYNWNNLYYACADCNQYRKRAAFPLVDETNRALDHHGAIGNEDPLILDPGGLCLPFISSGVHQERRPVRRHW